MQKNSVHQFRYTEVIKLWKLPAVFREAYWGKTF